MGPRVKAGEVGVGEGKSGAEKGGEKSEMRIGSRDERRREINACPHLPS
jgi:hypothetical protein